MAKERFDAGQFKPEGLRQVQIANEFIMQYMRKGMKLSLRQLYYRMVAKNHIPNSFRSYKNFGNLIDMGRKRGLIDWDAIEDRTRNLKTPLAFDDAKDFIEYAPNWYFENAWLDQDRMPEVWVEKDAQIAILEHACETRRVPYFACRGYVSQSEAYNAGKRFERYIAEGRDPIVFYLGDHDPSGVDMSRDLFSRVSTYAGQDIEFVRLALTMEQIETYNPPPQPVKTKDSRADGYREEHGDGVWEMDALEPQIIIDTIQNAIEALIDEDKWQETMKRQNIERQKVTDIAENWNTALAAARGEDPDETEYE